MQRGKQNNERISAALLLSTFLIYLWIEEKTPREINGECFPIHKFKINKYSALWIGVQCFSSRSGSEKRDKKIVDRWWSPSLHICKIGKLKGFNLNLTIGFHSYFPMTYSNTGVQFEINLVNFVYKEWWTLQSFNQPGLSQCHQ